VIDQARLKRAATILAAVVLSACGNASTAAPGPSLFQPAAKIQRGGASRPSYVPACPCLYVSNEGDGPYGNGVIDIFPVNANGNFNPAPNTIGGSNTGILYPRDVAVGSTGTIYVANSNFGGTDRVTVYTAGSSGNVAPIQTISGSNTLLSNIFGIAVDTPGNIYVSSTAINGPGAGTVNVFAPGATGNVAPIRTISGALTGIYRPFGLTVDPTGNLYVMNETTASSWAVSVFAPAANGNVAPLRTITGSHTGFDNDTTGIAWFHGPPPVGRIYVTGNNGVAIFRANVAGNATPAKTISGALTDLNQPGAVALAPGGRIFVSNLGQNMNGTFDVTKYTSFAGLAPGNNNVAPIHTIVGGNTDLWLPDGLAVH
jgi:hypothetical protein